MEERIIKKIAELVYKDIKRCVQPLIGGIKELIIGFISGASIVLLNKKGYQIYEHIERKYPHEFPYILSLWLSMVGLILFFIGNIFRVGKPFILFLVVSHSIGIAFIIKDYIIHKQQQAMEELNKKKTNERKDQKEGINK